MKKLASKNCRICNKLFNATKNDRPNSWNKRIFCSLKCSNSRKENKGLFKKGHTNLSTYRFPKGNIPWNMGKKHMQDDKHPNWKGDEVGYDALHKWIKRKLGKPSKCENCKKQFEGKNIHWANKTGLYKRNTTDWLRLCAKCHRQYDLLNNLLNKYGKK